MQSSAAVGCSGATAGHRLMMPCTAPRSRAASPPKGRHAVCGSSGRVSTSLTGLLWLSIPPSCRVSSAHPAGCGRLAALSLRGSGQRGDQAGDRLGVKFRTGGGALGLVALGRESGLEPVYVPAIDAREATLVRLRGGSEFILIPTLLPTRANRGRRMRTVPNRKPGLFCGRGQARTGADPELRTQQPLVRRSSRDVLQSLEC
jgi:hypothetical protein